MVIDGQRIAGLALNECKAFISFVIRKSVSVNFRNLIKEDLYQYGVLGLLEAKRKFDPERGVKFTTFSYFYVKRNILDGLKEMNIYHCRHEDSLKLEKAETTFFEGYETKEILKKVKMEFSDLPEKEHLVMDLLYAKELSLGEAAKTLGWQKPWVSKLHTKAITRLQKRLHLRNA